MVEQQSFDNMKPRITVIGVGGAGGNAVNNMIRSNLEGVEFIVANTDAQALKESLTDQRIQLGTETTQGLGAGSKPDIGRASAEEDLEEVQKNIKGSNMVFITAGMGGGTGTGAAPVIAQTAREMGILTVGVVTKPFHFEGGQRMKLAELGIQEMQHHVDTLIIIPNQNLFRLANDRTTFADAFNMADNVLYSGVRGVTDLMIMPGLINLDFADVRTVMSEMGKAMMGTGEAEGDNRAIEAAESAISNPLLDDVSMRGARGVLINITGGMDMTLFEVDEAANRIREEVDPEANIIFGSTFDERMSGLLRVSVVATGIDVKKNSQGKKTSTSSSPFMGPLKKSGDVHSELNLGGNELELDSLLQETETTQQAQKNRLGAKHSSEERNEAEYEPTEMDVHFSKEQNTRALDLSKPTRKSFWEKMGFKKKTVVDPYRAHNKEEHYTHHAPKGGDVHKNTPHLEDSSERSEEEEIIDIPAFLRKKDSS